MLKKLREVSVVMLVSGLCFKAAYADIAMPPDQFKEPVKQFNYIYNIAFNNDVTWADYKLATYYEKGYGVSKDIIKAYAWYRIASGHNPEFAKSLNLLKARMTPEQIVEGDKEYDKVVSATLDQMEKSINQTHF